MADNFMVNISEGFDIDRFAEEVVRQYQAKGFKVTALKMGETVKLTFDKGLGGINTVLGLGVGISANCMVNGNTLNVNFTEAEWTSKIIGCVLGWFVCLIPFITGIIGVTRQLQVPKDLTNDMQMIAVNMR